MGSNAARGIRRGGSSGGHGDRDRAGRPWRDPSACDVVVGASPWRDTRLRRARGAAFVAIALAALGGCTPSTPYRYTGLAPAAKPLPFDGRTAPDGSIRAEGHIAVAEVAQKPYAEIHDTALHVPEVTAEGSVMLAPTRGFEFGVRGSYAAYGWSSASTSGTLPLPSRGPTYGFGPEAHGTIRFGRTKAFGLGFGANLVFNSLPFAQWTRTDVPPATCSPGVPCVRDKNGVEYALFGEARETHLTFTAAVVPSYAFGPGGEYGHAFGSFGLTTGFENDGFTDRAQNGSTIASSGPIFVPGAGYGVDLLDVVHASAMLYWPITTLDSPVRYGPGGMLSLGFDLEIFHGRERDWRSRMRHEANDAPYEHRVPLPEPRPAPPPEAPPQAPAPSAVDL